MGWGLDSSSAVVLSGIGGVLAALKRCLAQGLPVRADTWTNEEEDPVRFGAQDGPRARFASAGAPMSDSAASLAQDTVLAPGGHYPTWRAAQLSGVPERALERWVRRGVLVPDFTGLPQSWTYRDLLFARMVASLLNDGLPPWEAAYRAASAKRAIAAREGGETPANGGSPSGGAGDSDEEGEEPPDPASFLGEFALANTAKVKELGKRDLWGPDLRHPSARTFIDPSIEQGEPCVRGTTIQTRALLSLHVERGIDAAALPAVYEELDAEDVADALALEARLRANV
jgi:uncharacterized protein (DUF433 family)